MPGLNALIRVSDAGDNCPDGGLKIETGLDTNGDGQLQDDEVNPAATAYVCSHGPEGGAGGNGGSGGSGGADCTTGQCPESCTNSAECGVGWHCNCALGTCEDAPVVEICDGADNDCTGQVDDAPLSSLCPNIQHGMQTCSGAQGCAIASCEASYYDLDGVFANGCEARQDGFDALGDGNACASAVSVGSIPSGGNTQVTANILPAGDVDWYQVQFSALNGQIRFDSNPGNFLFDLFQGPCGSAPIATNLSTPTNISTSAVVRVRVYHPANMGQVTNYSLRLVGL